MMNDAMKLFDLSGRTVLVTGATGHLGAKMSLALAEAGAQVLINSRNEEKAVALADRICSAGLRARPAVFDVNDEAQISQLSQHVDSGELHVLINNAYAGNAGSLVGAKAQDYTDSFNVSVTAAHLLMQAALPFLRNAVSSTGDASIINIASMYGVVSPDLRVYAEKAQANPPFYGASKAALIQLTRYAATEFGSENIRVNSVSPGPFPNAEVQDKQPEFVTRLNQKVPLGRIGQADEIRGPVLFLASRASSYVTGANLVVDGGWTSW
ncbi:MAG: SDR family oxidoreductase [Pseudomonadota bacterium]